MKSFKKNTINILSVLFLLLIVNYFGNVVYKRFDLTKDNRYTISDQTLTILNQIDQPAIIKVYLEGNFPAEFKRIQQETKQHLEELSSLNSNIKFRFINPLTKSKELVEKGLQPSKLSVQENGQVSQEIIFPWAIIEYNGKSENVSLLDQSTSSSQEEQLQKSIENLEYSFSKGLYNISQEKSKKIAVLRGNGELPDIRLYSYLKAIGNHYHLAQFTLDSVETNPESTINNLNNYDMVIVAKPTERFSDQEKFTLDQYIANNGKTLWLIDNILAETDSLMNTGEMLALNRDLNLTDLLFNYGVRVNFNVSKDLYSSTLRLAAGNSGNQTQFQDFPWIYYPLVLPVNEHSISKNLDPILLKYPSAIDTLKNNLSKTVILQSSPLSKIVGTPTNIALNEIAQKPDQKNFNDSNIIFGVLLEGKFTSAYANRQKPVDISTFKSQSDENKMIVISDGDIISNEVRQGEPQMLNTDDLNRPIGNLDFLINATNYLLDDSGLLELRSKQLKFKFLDKQKAFNERIYWQVINVVIPIIIILVFGFIFNLYRKKRYAS